MKKLNDLALTAANGNVHAADFLMMIVGILHLWDDLIDRDKPLNDWDINTAFRNALVELPRNPFYRAHFDDLNPVLSTAITNWLVANKFERDGDPGYQECAFIIRSSYVDLVTATATICGGVQHGYEVGIAVRQLAHKEGFAEYQQNLITEKQTREGVQHVL